MNAKDFARRLSLLVALLAAVHAVGCVYVEVTHREAGALLGTQELQFVLPGVTTREALIQMYGKPTRAETTAEGGEVLEYAGTRFTTTSTRVFPVYSSGKSGGVMIRTLFELKDGVVQDYRTEQE